MQRVALFEHTKGLEVGSQSFATCLESRQQSNPGEGRAGPRLKSSFVLTSDDTTPRIAKWPIPLLVRTLTEVQYATVLALCSRGSGFSPLAHGDHFASLYLL
jgi:hypothetical protein